MIKPKTARRLVLAFRFSKRRHAYVLRGVGEWVGPVLEVPNSYRGLSDFERLVVDAQTLTVSDADREAFELSES
jgi:hypothetical protein